MAVQRAIPTPQLSDKVYEAARLRYRAKLLQGSTGNYYDDLISLTRRNPVVGAIVDLYRLGLERLAPSYINEDDEKNEFVKSQLSQRNSIPRILSRMSLTPLAGHGVAKFTPVSLLDGRWGIASVDSIWYRDFTFKRDKKTRELVGIEMNDRPGELVPIELVVHLLAGEHLAFENPHGVGSFERVQSVAEAWSLLMDDMTTAGRRQATPLVYALVEEGVSRVLDQYGNPIMNGDTEVTADNVYLASKQLEQLTNNGDTLAMKAGSELGTLDQAPDSDFFENCIRLCMQLAFIALLSPETILASHEGGFGNSEVSRQHAETLENLIVPFAKDGGDEILEKVIKPLIYWNYGEQDDYGRMEPKKKDDPDRIDLLNILGQYAQDAFADERVNQKVIELIGV